AVSEVRAPRTETERVLCEVFAVVLGVGAVGIDDDFFTLGGDSISSLTAANRARKVGLRIRPRNVFESRTPARLAEFLDGPVAQRGDADLQPEVRSQDVPASEVEALVSEAVRRPFALGGEAPLRVDLLRTAPDAAVVVLVVHHIAVDDWSIRGLVADLSAAYAARVAGREPAFAPLPVSYADFAGWQAE